LHGLVETLTIKSGGIDTRIHDFPGLVEALAIKSGGIDTPIHDLHGLVKALTIKSGGIDTRIHDFPGLVETLAIKSGGIDTIYNVKVSILLTCGIHCHDRIISLRDVFAHKTSLTRRFCIASASTKP
jgi:hypothetical protein